MVDALQGVSLFGSLLLLLLQFDCFVKSFPRFLIVLILFGLHEFLETAMLLDVFEVVAWNAQLQLQLADAVVQVLILFHQRCHYLVFNSHLNLSQVLQLPSLLNELIPLDLMLPKDVRLFGEELLLAFGSLLKDSLYLILKVGDSLLEPVLLVAVALE